MPKIAKKLVSVTATFTPITEASTKSGMVLDRIPYIYYLPRFNKDKEIKVWTLINAGSKINAITLAYASMLDLPVWQTKIRVEEIDGFTIKTLKIVLINF